MFGRERINSNSDFVKLNPLKRSYYKDSKVPSVSSDETAKKPMYQSHKIHAKHRKNNSLVKAKNQTMKEIDQMRKIL